MDFGVNIKNLSDVDLVRYKDFLFEKLLGVVQSEKRRLILLDRIELVAEEEVLRHGKSKGNNQSSSVQARHATTTGAQRVLHSNALKRK
jgi:hypothetical protein